MKYRKEKINSLLESSKHIVKTSIKSNKEESDKRFNFPIKLDELESEINQMLLLISNILKHIFIESLLLVIAFIIIFNTLYRLFILVVL